MRTGPGPGKAEVSGPIGPARMGVTSVPHVIRDRGLPRGPSRVRPRPDDGRELPRSDAVRVQRHGRPSIAAYSLGAGKRPAPIPTSRSVARAASYASGWPTRRSGSGESAGDQAEPCHSGYLPVTVVSADQEGGDGDHRDRGSG